MGSWGPPPGQGYGGGGPGYGGPPLGRPYGPPRAPYGGGYGYAPPRRRGGGGVLVVGLFGLLAFLGIGVALFLKATAEPPGPPPVATPSHIPGHNGANAAVANRLYRIGRLPSTGCRGVRITQGDPRSFQRFLDGTSDCLDSAWRQGFAREGLRFTAPQRVFWSTPGTSPCGSYPAPGVAAFYCPANASMYIGVSDAQKAAGGLPVRYNVAYAREIAHEYGHAIQDMSGILAYSDRARTSASTTLGRNAVVKRSELQAQCLSGVFMGSVRGSFPVGPGQWSVALRDSYGRGDDGRPLDQRDHGSDAHYGGWLNLGYRRDSTAVCNTWAARSSSVS